MQIASRIAVWNRFAAGAAETPEVKSGGKNHWLRFMQTRPVWCHYPTRPTGVPELIVLDDSGVDASFSLF